MSNTPLSIHQSSYGSARFDKYKIGCSSVVEYFPLISITSSELFANYNSEEGIPKVHIFYKPYANKASLIPNGYSMSKILDVLDSSNQIKRYFIDNKREQSLFFGKGIILDENQRILLCVVGKISSGIGQSFDNLSYDDTNEYAKENFFVFVANEFVKEPQFSTFYKKLEKDYLSSIYQDSIELRVVSSEKIDKLLFSNNFEIKFSSITELNNRLESISDILFKDSDYFENHYPGINSPVNMDEVARQQFESSQRLYREIINSIQERPLTPDEAYSSSGIDGSEIHITSPLGGQVVSVVDDLSEDRPIVTEYSYHHGGTVLPRTDDSIGEDNDIDNSPDTMRGLNTDFYEAGIDSSSDEDEYDDEVENEDGEYYESENDESYSANEL